MSKLVRFKIYNKNTGEIYSPSGWFPNEQAGKVHTFTLEEVERLVPQLEALGYPLEIERVLKLSSSITDRELPNAVSKSKWIRRGIIFGVSLILCYLYMQFVGGFDTFTKLLTK